MKDKGKREQEQVDVCRPDTCGRKRRKREDWAIASDSNATLSSPLAQQKVPEQRWPLRGRLWQAEMDMPSTPGLPSHWLELSIYGSRAEADSKGSVSGSCRLTIFHASDFPLKGDLSGAYPRLPHLLGIYYALNFCLSFPLAPHRCSNKSIK